MRSESMRAFARATVLAFAIAGGPAAAALPQPIAQGFRHAGVPVSGVSVVVQRVGDTRPMFTHQPDAPMNPASVMKLVTTFAALELLGRDYRWKTEAYLGGPLAAGTLKGDLILKGYGDPKITIEQWQALIAMLRDKGIEAIDGDLVLDRSRFALPPHDPAAFDGEPLRPYNVAPDAMLVNFKAVRLTFAPNAAGDAVDVRMEPALPMVVLGRAPDLVDGNCADWRAAVDPAVINQPNAAALAFNGRYPRGCGERDWHLALLDHPGYVHGIFAAYFGAAGGRFAGAVREGAAPAGAVPFVTLESPPLYDIVRDVNKLSNNVMARQMFLTLATVRGAPPATPRAAGEAVQRWLAARRLSLPGLVLENGSGLSRTERITAGGLARLLAAADASPVREEFESSLAVAAMDGTLVRRFLNGSVAGQALLKTGSLEGVRALAGYVIDGSGRRFIVVAIVNHPRAGQAQAALDNLVQWVYREAGAYAPRPRESNR
jgi:serine-type D-Ala-D-Ala carboxypeptidase/endopeptidase (penicillin-binding protein 4)